MPTAKQFLAEAAKHIGTYGDHNIFNKWYWVDYTKIYSKDPGTAWCATFMSYVAMKTGLKCSYSASAAGFGTQFARIPVEKEGTVQPGDIVVFNWDGRNSLGWCDHVAVVEWSTIGQNGLFGTIEGNTGNKAEGEVLRVTRNNWSNYFTAFFRPKWTASTSASAAASSKKSKLYGIDVSGGGNQPADIFKKVEADFGIVKVSGNPHGYKWNYVNPDAKQQAADIYKKTGLLGLYLFTYGRDRAEEEADFFLQQVAKLGYLKKAMLVIDYEAQAVEKGRTWVKALADRIKSKAGYSPVVYASGGVIVNQKLFDLGYPIWCANYYKGYSPVKGYDTSGMTIYPGCEKSVLWQFTSQGFLSGYSAALDLDVFFGTADDWKKLAGITSSQSSSSSAAEAQTAPSQKKKASSKKTVAQIAQEVIAGKWGNGAEREKKLKAAGYDYSKVQAKVNSILGSSGRKSVDEIAREVIQGKWGNGSDRKSRLEKAGYDYSAVQNRVNELLY